MKRRDIDIAATTHGRRAEVLRPPRPWLLLAAIAGLLLGLQFLRPNWPGLWTDTLLNVLHAPLFGLVALCLLTLSSRRQSATPRRRLLLALAAAALIGVLSEAAQIPGPRDAALGDVLTNWLGAAGFTLLAVALGRFVPLPAAQRRLAGLGAAIALGLAIWPLLVASGAVLERRSLYPVLFDPAAPFAGQFLVRQNSQVDCVGFPDGGLPAYRVTLRDGRWPGLVFHDIWPDWSSHEALLVTLGSDDDRPLNLRIRIHDRRHLAGTQAYEDRFTTRFELTRGLHTLRIPLEAVREAPETRAMEMHDIEGMAVFGNARDAGRRFYLRSIRLE